MKTQAIELSALLDGEFEAHEVQAVVRMAMDSDEMRDRWQVYALIGDGLRGECQDSPDMTANVMARIREEPVVLAPRNLLPARRQHPLLALAASVAGVAVVGWLALAGNPRAPAAEGRLAAASPAPSLARVQPRPAAEPPRAGKPMSGDMNEYLLAHHMQAGTPIQPGASTRQVRTVSMNGAAERP